MCSTFCSNQLCFFKKSLKSLETVEPHVKSVTERQHIDYQFDELGDDDWDDDEDNDNYIGNSEGELSFDYGQCDVPTSRSSMEVAIIVFFPSFADKKQTTFCDQTLQFYLHV